MKFPSRRKPLTLIFCCSFAGTLAASVAGEAHGQSPAPLRVDPTLLGLPAMPRVEPPARLRPDLPAAESRPVEEAAVETLPMPRTAVEPSPTPPKRAEIPAPEPVAPRVESPPPLPAAPQARAAPSEAVPEPSTARQTRAEAPAVRPSPAPVPTPVSAPTPPAPVAVSAPATSAAKGSPPALQMARTMQPPPAGSEVPRPIFVSGQQISGQLEREVVAEGDAELRKVSTVLTADRLTYWPIDDEVDALGHVRLQQGGDFLTGSKGRLKLESQIGFIDDASYLIKRQASTAGTRAGEWSPTKVPSMAADQESTTGFAAPQVLDIKPGQTRLKTSDKAVGEFGEFAEARGEAERIDFEGENQIRMTAATYTTCPPGNDDWYLGVAALKLDYDNDVGTAKDATVRFLEVPILYSPWLSFALNDERKSGFLVPSYGSSDTSGIEFSLPYYWNIAPNLDATIEPRILSKRGVQFGGDFRYLNEAYGGLYKGKTTVEYLPDDRQAGIDRWGVALNHSQVTANGFSGVINYNRVSDNDYYTDLSSQVASTSQTQLLQQGVLSYGGAGWWTATANVQSFQTLQPDPQNPVSQPYRLLPQITLNARQPDLYFTDSAFFGQFTEFVHPDANVIEGQRSVLQPEISLPYVTPGWYVTPRVALNATHYSLSYPTGGVGSDSISRTLPIFSVDSGMTFERLSNWFGRDYTQTLEPRLFYLNIPYENQDDIPVFDTGLADFNFAQIFADNQFSGWDRINNANQLTAAVSSRLIDPSSGNEIMRGMLGQRFYFTDDKVTLPGATQRKWDKSDFLAGFTGQIWPRVYADAALQYDTGDQEFERYALGARYLPAPGRVFNAIYSFNSEAATPIKQVDFSGQWPISGRWQAVGRYNYSFLQNQPIEIIGGLEYNAGCWAVRTVVHRLQTSEADATTQFFVQLQLTGLASLGSNPLGLLQRRIPGYMVGSTPMDQGLAEW